MRLIDVDDLIDFIDMGHLRNPIESCFSERDVVDMLESRLTVDAVPVVRCEKCVLHGNCVTEDAFVLAGIENPFCCAGKRKEDKHENYT